MKTLKNGFTLIELLVVIGIIATLTAMATYNFNQARVRARDVQRKNDIKAIQSALELYKNDHSQMFPTFDGNLHSIIGTNLDKVLVDGGYAKAPGYSDPKETSKTGSWSQYKYQETNGGTGYILDICFENASDPLFGDVTRPVDGSDVCGVGGRLLSLTNP